MYFLSRSMITSTNDVCPQLTTRTRYVVDVSDSILVKDSFIPLRQLLIKHGVHGQRSCLCFRG
jgi:hypothetical protein